MDGVGRECLQRPWFYCLYLAGGEIWRAGFGMVAEY